MSSGSAGKIIRRGISDVLLVLAVALFAAAAGLWMSSRETYAAVEESSERMQEFAEPAPKESEPPTVDWEGLLAVNPQVVAWICIPNTSINYPVVQADNNEYYLHRNLERNYSEGGSIFLDFENTAPGMTNQQSIVYGHHMKNGVMFKQVADFNIPEFFTSVDTIWYLTPEYTYELQPLFLMYAQGSDTSVRQFNFDTDEAYRAYLKNALSQAATQAPEAEQAIKGIKRTLSLCTCNYIEGKGRSVLFCAEKADVQNALAGI